MTGSVGFHTSVRSVLHKNVPLRASFVDVVGAADVPVAQFGHQFHFLLEELFLPATVEFGEAEDFTGELDTRKAAVGG